VVLRPSMANRSSVSEAMSAASVPKNDIHAACFAPFVAVLLACSPIRTFHAIDKTNSARRTSVNSELQRFATVPDRFTAVAVRVASARMVRRLGASGVARARSATEQTAPYRPTGEPFKDQPSSSSVRSEITLQPMASS